MEVLRKRRAGTREVSMALGEQRMAVKRRCPVPDCKGHVDTYSRYCNDHAMRLKRHGHPTVDLTMRTRKDYDNAVQVGRWLRKALTENDSDARAWLRIEGRLEQLGKDHRLKYDIPTLYRRRSHFRNEFKARCVISRKLEIKPAEELIAGYLGHVAVVLLENELLVNTKQLSLMLNKAGGRVISWRGRYSAMEEGSGKMFTWRPSPGVQTKIGEVVFELIAGEFSKKWFKEAEIKLVTRGYV